MMRGNWVNRLPQLLGRRWKTCRETTYDLNVRTAGFHRKGLAFLAYVWTLSLVSLLVYLFLQSAGILGVDIGACHPDGAFSPLRNSYNWWASKGFFQITLRLGDFSFAGVKLLDVMWNLIVGRGGQGILALISWRTFAEYLTVSMVAKPASYRTVWLLKFQTEPSAMSALRLAREFASPRRLASPTAMCFIIAAAMFVLGFPTLVGSMTGYTTANAAYVEQLDDMGLANFSQTYPVAYVIHDGDRVGLKSNFPVAYETDTEGDPVLDKETYLPESYCSGHNVTTNRCALQSKVTKYQWEYGPLSPSWNKGESDQDITFWDPDGDNITLSDGPLNISTFYLPDSFVTAGLSDQEPEFEKRFRSKHRLKYYVSGNLYNITEIKKAGICHPIRDKFQWGFSFLQLIIMTACLLLWTVGIGAMRMKAHLTLKRNGLPATSTRLKGLLEFAEIVESQLRNEGIDHRNLDDHQLEQKIMEQLKGGKVRSPDTLSEGTYSLRSGLREWVKDEKVLLGAVLFWVPVCAVDYAYKAGGGKDGDIVSFAAYLSTYVICGTSIAAILSYGMRGDDLRGPLVFVAVTIVFVAYYFVYALVFLSPGVVIGAGLAMIFGPTKNSRAILFAVPFSINFVVGFSVFHGMRMMQSMPSQRQHG